MVALNVTDPLTTRDMSAYRQDTNQARRDLLSDKVLEGRLLPVSRGSINNGSSQLYRLYISSMAIDIPVAMDQAMQLHLVAVPQVHVTFEVTHDLHTHPFALKAIPSDDASKVGIKLTTPYGDSAFHLQKEKPSAVADANALYDFLKGKLNNITIRTPEQWGWDRNPFLGPYRQAVSRTS